MAKDLYRYFRVEARELLEGLSAGVLAVEAGGGPDAVGRVLRLTHTLKGAARAVRHLDIANDSHGIEEILAPWRAGGVVPSDQIALLFAGVDRIALAIAAMDGTSTVRETAAAEPARVDDRLADGGRNDGGRIDTVRIEIAEVEELLVGVVESAAHLSSLRRDVAALEPTRRLASALRARLAQRPGAPASDGAALDFATELVERLDELHLRLEQGVDRTERELIGARDHATRLRLVDASAIFPTLLRTARDATTALGRRASLHTSGGGVHLDAHVLVAVRQAMIHLVNNAVAHGIEPERARALAGKPPEGRIDVQVEQHATYAVFRCSDDGGGVQVIAVRDAAVRKGLLDAEAARTFTLDSALQLLLRGGLSTTATVSPVAGRGVGLDVVRETAARLEGRLQIRSEPGRGTVVELYVPMSLWSLEALEVESDGVSVLLPLEGVHAVAPITPDDIAWSPTGRSVRVGGDLYPHVTLPLVLRRPTRPSVGRGPVVRKGRSAVVLLQAGTRRCALEVDRLLGTRRVVMRPLPSLAPVDDVVAGAALDAEGTPQPVLDINSVLHLALAGTGSVRPAAPTRSAPVLVIDDSLTTRMLEQSILESAGYEVDLAASAEAGLVRARSRRYGLFIVDVEMPGMDGFGFVTETRADPELRDIPAILVTSRASAEDRTRGLAAGAHAYLIKSEFDQERLLAIIRGLGV